MMCAPSNVSAVATVTISVKQTHVKKSISLQKDLAWATCFRKKSHVPLALAVRHRQLLLIGVGCALGWGHATLILLLRICAGTHPILQA